MIEISHVAKKYFKVRMSAPQKISEQTLALHGLFDARALRLAKKIDNWRDRATAPHD
jgi:hypothetical protein